MIADQQRSFELPRGSAVEAFGFGRLLVRELGLGDPEAEPDLDGWRALVERIKAPKELWVYEDTYHQTTMFPALGQRMDCHSMGMDWMTSRLKSL